MAGSNFVDYVKIFARSGHGGAGSAHFRREKFVAFGGPDGGDGGKGGSIVLQGDSQYWTLIHLKYQRHQFAEDGQCGSGARSSGKDAKDIVIPVPLGTVAKRIVTQEDGTETVARGTVEGRIGYGLQGDGGFGYDPLFYPDVFKGALTLAEVSQDEKNAVSHRGNALRELKAKIASRL